MKESSAGAVRQLGQNIGCGHLRLDTVGTFEAKGFLRIVGWIADVAHIRRYTGPQRVDSVNDHGWRDLARSISEDDSSDSIEVMRKPGDTKTMTRWPGMPGQTFQNLFDRPVDIVRLGVAAGQRSLAGRFGQVLRFARSWSDRPWKAHWSASSVATRQRLRCRACSGSGRLGSSRFRWHSWIPLPLPINGRGTTLSREF